MKYKNIQYKWISIVVCALCGMLLSCSEDVIPTSDEYERGLNIIPKISGVRAESTVPADASLNEDALKSMDVFIADASGDVLKHYAPQNPTNGEYAQLEKSLDDYNPGTTYTVYVVANANTEERRAISQAVTLMEVQNTIRDEADIYKPYGNSTDGKHVADKTFLMEGTCSWTYKGERDVKLDVSLERAAAKIVLDYKLNEEMGKSYTIGTPHIVLQRYAGKTLLGKDGNVEIANAVKQQSEDLAIAGNTVTTYSYSRTWETESDAASFLMTLPLTDKATGKTNNYTYLIPVRDLSSTANFKMERNYIYRVHATISTLGSTGETVIPNSVKLSYEVLPWLTEDVNVNVNGVKYLQVTPTDVIIKNTETATVKFYSSSPITSVRLADYTGDNGETGNGPYYYNAFGYRINMNGLSPVDFKWDTKLKSGEIAINSELLTKITQKKPDEIHAVKFFQFIVTNADGLTQRIRVKQYPREFITFQKMLYSTRTDVDKNGKRIYYDWYLDGAGQPLAGMPNRKSYDSPNGNNKEYLWHCWIYSPNEDADILGYKLKKESNPPMLETFVETHHSNSRAYVIQIMQADPDKGYHIGRIDGTNLVSDNDNNLVSPAFMINSHLGQSGKYVSKRIDLRNSKYAKYKNAFLNHAKHYKEVPENAEHKSEGVENWRLPTEAELQLIERFQANSTSEKDDPNDKSVMNKVLSGRNYWTANGTYRKVTSSTINGPWLRLVHDLTQKEIDELNANME